MSSKLDIALKTGTNSQFSWLFGSQHNAKQIAECSAAIVSS